MSGSKIRRWEKPETNRPPSHGRRGPRAITCDELVVGRLDLLRHMAANPDRDQESRVAAAAGVAEIEAWIRQQAAFRSGPQHQAKQAHLASIGWDPINYVPAATPDGERDSLDTPRLITRRAAL